MILAADVKPKFTYEDYARLPDDGVRYEMIDGELIEMPSPSVIHQLLIFSIGLPLREFVKSLALGTVIPAPVDVILANNVIVQPDLVFVSRERARIIAALNILGAPDLVVEILSPSTADYDRTRKRELYAKHGVREYWLINPYAKTATILRLGASGYDAHAVFGEGDALTSPTFPGLALDMSDLFNETF